MEDPRPQIQAALKDAMRNKDNARRDTLRMLLNAVRQVEIDERRELSAEDVTAILQKEAKRRRESIDEYTKAGREDLAEGERAELAIIEEFLPQQLSREEIMRLAQEVVAQVGASSPKDMGKVMGALMPKVKGLADGKLVNEVVRELLS
ncbi:MAG: GatB/YqeY domain-containing protein [Chloroflexi bacterium]|nr:MAG: GatB/YqeY domain-containing protein [Chloroflexota bacterium]